MFGILGRNGSEIYINECTTILQPSKGTVTINGEIKNSQKIRQMIGYLPQDFNMKVSEVLYYLGFI